jgi:hypothetical protein
MALSTSLNASTASAQATAQIASRPFMISALLLICDRVYPSRFVQMPARTMPNARYLAIRSLSRIACEQISQQKPPRCAAIAQACGRVRTDVLTACLSTSSGDSKCMRYATLRESLEHSALCDYAASIAQRPASDYFSCSARCEVSSFGLEVAHFSSRNLQQTMGQRRLA